MDDMAITWESPQEDEFALCNLGVPSPYRTVAFPNHPPQCQEYLDLENIGLDERLKWQHALMRFLKQITYRTPKRIVLKSPPHTCRIPALLEMFPDARFVHIVRNPYEVFFSTVKTWKRLYEGQGFQKPRFEGLEEYVFETYLRMQRRLDATRGLVAPNRFHELRYEDLVSDPVGQLRTAYERLELDDFERVAPAIEAYQASRASYKTKPYAMASEDRRRIAERWGEYIARYGYSLDSAQV
jgi:hypothetical protein